MSVCSFSFWLSILTGAVPGILVFFATNFGSSTGNENKPNKERESSNHIFTVSVVEKKVQAVFLNTIDSERKTYFSAKCEAILLSIFNKFIHFYTP